MRSRSITTRVRDLLANPSEELSSARRRIEQLARRRELVRQAYRRLGPLVLPRTGSAQVHVLLGRRTVAECLWALHSLLRYAAKPLPVLLHDDGTLTRGDCALLNHFYPGIQILPRAQTDSEINARLETAGLQRLLALRREYVPALKILDLQFYAVGRRVLYIDTDVLFHQRPDLLLSAMEEDPENSTAWYNVDSESWYTWTPDDLESHTGIRPRPRVNTGVFTIPSADTSWWARYEDWLGVPRPWATKWSGWQREQTLWALHFTAIQAQALPEAEYDVHHRHAWAGVDRDAALRTKNHGAPVVSQHYSGTWDYRQMFYDALRTSFFD